MLGAAGTYDRHGLRSMITSLIPEHVTQALEVESPLAKKSNKLTACRET
jgi:hypothetical protein